MPNNNLSHYLKIAVGIVLLATVIVYGHALYTLGSNYEILSQAGTVTLSLTVDGQTEHVVTATMAEFLAYILVQPLEYMFYGAMYLYFGGPAVIYTLRQIKSVMLDAVSMIRRRV